MLVPLSHCSSTCSPLAPVGVSTTTDNNNHKKTDEEPPSTRVSHNTPNRRRRRRTAGRQQQQQKQKVVWGLVAVGAGMFWTAAILVLSLQLQNVEEETTPLLLEQRNLEFQSKPVPQIQHPGRNNRNQPQQPQQEQAWIMDAAPPGRAWQLWPDDAAAGAQDMVEVLTPTKNHVAASSTTTTTQVILICPPGVLGHVLHDFVMELVTHISSHEGALWNVHVAFTPDDISHIMGTISHHPRATTTTSMTNVKVIHTISLPVLLEAVDVALVAQDETHVPPPQGTAQHNDHPATVPPPPTWKDLELMVQQMVQWHVDMHQQYSEASTVTNPLPTLLLTLQSTLMIPQKNEGRLLHFLLDHPDQATQWSNTLVIPRDDLAHQVLDRVDQATSLWQRSLASERDQQQQQQQPFRSSHSWWWSWWWQPGDPPTDSIPDNPLESEQAWIAQQLERASSTRSATTTTSSTTSPWVNRFNKVLHEQPEPSFSS